MTSKAHFFKNAKRVCAAELIGNLSNDNGDGNENVTNLHI